MAKPHFRAPKPPVSNLEQPADSAYCSAHKSVAVPDKNRLALDWLFDTGKGTSLSDRVLARFILWEAKAETISEREHWRQCFITLSFAAKGSPIPAVEASYLMFGTHPDELFPSLTALRQAKLGAEYDQWFDAAGNLKPDIPHKTAKRFPMGTGRLVDEEPSADGASSLPAIEREKRRA